MGRLRSRSGARRRAPAGVRAVVVLSVVAILAAFPRAAAATIEGGCTAIGTSTSGGAVDLTTTSVWHLRTSDEVSVSGSAPFEETEGSATAYAFGFAIPISSGWSEGATSFESDTYDVSMLALLGRVFVVAGASSGPFHACDGQVEIVIDDVNPLLTVLGGGSVAAISLGWLGLLWALRRSDGTWRRIVGLFALGLIGGGAALLLQQVSTPGQEGPAVAGWVAAVAGPGQVSLEPLVLVQAAGLSLLLVVLMPFPSELFNKTLEENLTEIRAAWTRVPVLGRLVRAPDPGDPGPKAPVGWRHPLAVAAIVLLGSLLYGFLDPAFGPDRPSLLLYFGLVASLVVVQWLANLPRRAVQYRLTGDGGRLRAVPGTLLVAAACVVISRVAGFEPGYLYGLVLGYTFATEISADDEGRGLAGGAWWMLGIAIVAWFSLGAVRTPGVEPSIPAAVLASVLAALVVAGIEGVAFGLLPLRFLHGEAVYRWRRSHWAMLYALGLFAFFWIILNPAHGFVGSPSETSFLSAVALFVAFGVVSVLFWGYFRFRRQAVAAPRPPV